MKSSILDARFIQETMEVCTTIYHASWAENHAGNLSYLLTEEEVKAYLGEELPIIRSYPLEFISDHLANRYFLVTATGSAFKNIRKDPERHLGIIRIHSTGDGYDLIWGYNNNGRPTSELPTHLLCHNERMKTDDMNRIVLHCHPTYTIAMTMVHELDEDKWIKTMWQMNSECVLVFPEGLGVLPWMVCGNGVIGQETANKMREFRIVLWPYHGILAAGRSVDQALGLIETVEKAAQLYMLTYPNAKQCINDTQIAELAAAFNLTPRANII